MMRSVAFGTAQPVRFGAANTKSSVKEIENTQDFWNEVGKSKPTIVDFYATWCGPCKTLAPQFEAAARAKGDKFNFVKVDVDLNPTLARQFRIMSVPTLMVFAPNGQEDKHTALRKPPAESLSDFITRAADLG